MLPLLLRWHLLVGHRAHSATHARHVVLLLAWLLRAVTAGVVALVLHPPIRSGRAVHAKRAVVLDHAIAHVLGVHVLRHLRLALGLHGHLRLRRLLRRDLLRRSLRWRHLLHSLLFVRRLCGLLLDRLLCRRLRDLRLYGGLMGLHSRLLRGLRRPASAVRHVLGHTLRHHRCCALNTLCAAVVEAHAGKRRVQASHVGEGARRLFGGSLRGCLGHGWLHGLRSCGHRRGDGSRLLNRLLALGNDGPALGGVAPRRHGRSADGLRRLLRLGLGWGLLCRDGRRRRSGPELRRGHGGLHDGLGQSPGDLVFRARATLAPLVRGDRGIGLGDGGLRRHLHPRRATLLQVFVLGGRAADRLHLRQRTAPGYGVWPTRDSPAPTTASRDSHWSSPSGGTAILARTLAVAVVVARGGIPSVRSCSSPPAVRNRTSAAGSAVWKRCLAAVVPVVHIVDVVAVSILGVALRLLLDFRRYSIPSRAFQFLFQFRKRSVAIHSVGLESFINALFRNGGFTSTEFIGQKLKKEVYSLLIASRHCRYSCHDH
mmetsp:Transcript_125068/g.186809  ORF Transcript_125068/g.186809 Transcript_125068/m.186809 type:complete len:541 (-) Transcript_125068:28-1650(-)